jgi:zinc protease
MRDRAASAGPRSPRPWIVLVVGLLGSTLSPPGLAGTPTPPELALEAYRLPNGLKVALHRDPAVPRVTVCVAYHVGSKDERAGRTGFAHFFEHMMFRGTGHVPNYDVPLREAGTQSNAFTTEDLTVYYETVPAPYLERALYLEAERLAFLPSALDREKFDTEREVVKNERREAYENVPYGRAEEILLADVFPAGHPYSWPVIGAMRDLDRATLDDLRRFFAEYYHPGNATLCLAGDFDPARAKALIAEYFGPLKAGPPRRKVSTPPAPPVARRREQPDHVQLPRTYWAWPTVADEHPDAPALDLLASVLAGGEASRLYKALVRENRIAKDVAADSDTKEAAGLFTIRSTAAEGKPLREVAAVLAAELDRARVAPPSAGELERALAKHERATYHGLTPILGRAITLASGFALYDDPAHYRRDFERYFRVTPADLHRVARRYLAPEAVVLHIVSGEPKEPDIQAGPRPDSAKVEDAPAPRPPAAGPDWSKLPGPAEPRPFRAPRIVRKRLPNGVDVWVVPWRTLPVVEAHLVLPAGTADDPAGKSGLATLTATLLEKGTKTKTATELTEALDALGASLSAAAGADHTVLSLGVVARNLDPALALAGEVLASPRLDPEDFDRERQLQLADLLQGPDDIDWIAARAFPVLLYGPDHPYANPAEGRVATVKGLAVADVRRFRDAHFDPARSTLVVVGDVEPDALLTSLGKALGGWKSAGAPASRRPAPEPSRPEPGVVHLVDKPGAVQSVVSVGRRWAGRDDPRYFATRIGNRILGADFLSRLNQNLREQHGFTYGASSYFRFHRTDSVWAASTSVRTDATAPALKEVLSELDALAGAKPFTAEEVGVARDAEARSFPETFESPGGIAGILLEMVRHGLPPDYLDTFLDRLRAPEADAIARAMVEVVAPAARVVLVVGDRRAVEPKLKDLGFRKVRLVTPDGLPTSPEARAPSSSSPPDPARPG